MRLRTRANGTGAEALPGSGSRGRAEGRSGGAGGLGGVAAATAGPVASAGGAMLKRRAAGAEMVTVVRGVVSVWYVPVFGSK